MARLQLVMACDTQQLAPLYDGTVRLDDVDLEIRRIAAEERHHRMQHAAEFDVCEYSSINYLSAFDGGLPFTAIPIFPYRTFRHRDIWVSAAAGIQDPAQLNGKRVGIQSWANSAALWQRGACQHDFGVDLASIDWVRNLPEKEQPSWARIRQRPDDRTLDQLVLDGDLDAMMVPWPARFPPEAAGRARRLFPDYVAAEQDYYARTGAFPIMHLVVIKNAVLAEHPWVAERVYEGLRRALEAYVERQRAANAPSPIWRGLAWDEQERRIGPNPWPCGLSANRATLETAVTYALDQGLIARRISPEALFQREGRALVAAD